MTARYYRSPAGAYLGVFIGALPPGEAIEVPAPPQDARATWNGSAWVEPPPPPALVPLAVVLTRVIVLGGLTPLLAALQVAPDAAALLLTLREGIYADDPQARALLTLAGINPDQVLAP